MAFATAQPVGMASSQLRPLATSSRSSAARRVQRPSLVVRAEGGSKIREEVPGAPGVSVPDRSQKDSYEKIEAPVRGGEQQPGRIPDGGPPVAERRQARDDLYIQVDGSEEKQFLKTDVAFPDAMRFNGAAPEVINCRLAMLGCVAALAAEMKTHTTILQQFQNYPGFIAGTFTVFIVASLIPILRGVPRRGGKDWPGGISAFTPDAELTVGRVAMLGFFGIVLNEVLTKTPALTGL